MCLVLVFVVVNGMFCSLKSMFKVMTFEMDDKS